MLNERWVSCACFVMSSTLVLAPFAEPLAGHEATAAQVLTRSVPWESYSTAGVLTERDVQMIRRFDKRDKFTARGCWTRVATATSLTRRHA